MKKSFLVFNLLLLGLLNLNAIEVSYYENQVRNVYQALHLLVLESDNDTPKVFETGLILAYETSTDNDFIKYSKQENPEYWGDLAQSEYSPMFSILYLQSCESPRSLVDYPIKIWTDTNYYVLDGSSRLYNVEKRSDGYGTMETRRVFLVSDDEEKFVNDIETTQTVKIQVYKTPIILTGEQIKEMATFFDLFYGATYEIMEIYNDIINE